MKSKYIIIEYADLEVPLVFSAFLPHTAVAEKRKIKSAGFCELDPAGKWTTEGRSDPLNVNARPQDRDILNEHLNNSASNGRSSQTA